MITISVSDFKKNIKKYAELSAREKVLVSRGGGKAFYIVPIENVKDEGYSQEFIQNIQFAEKQIENGHSKKVHSVEELNLLLETM